MSAELAQYLLSGLTVGAIYALVALGFSIIYNASHVINFAQGEFVMIGGMATVSLLGAGLPLAPAALAAVALAALIGLLLARFAVQPARGASVVTLIIITIGASILLRGLASLVWDKRIHALPAFSGEAPIAVAGATLAPQSLWVIGVAALIVGGLWGFFNRTLTGKAILAVSHNRLAAQLMGISVRRVLLVSFALSAALGALAGILIAPITFTSWDVGVMLGLKGFAAAILGGMGSGPGAVVGGLTLGLLESLGAGYVSSAYKDAIAFIVMLVVLMLMPGGLLGGRAAERV
ncbi:MAG: branched-chain amino acid ABC transporter permease [Betaproteobacteria bacterium]|nr:branched-chain amino acid ABC transporter permease [Betaproteobacteria bacterium]MDH4325143.1 branched-chain amino acid ABC transporter permease [Betaproteobacteria bacterium]MDH5210162.1 branched-chain amino acid ABC transporter permease [Betaproteobacteria bacterium]MDH5578647.1 branched-chain amino acid ABC transporter permease [Betaproteobacteria bacterium]